MSQGGGGGVRSPLELREAARARLATVSGPTRALLPGEAGHVDAGAPGAHAAPPEVARKSKHDEYLAELGVALSPVRPVLSRLQHIEK